MCVYSGRAGVSRPEKAILRACPTSGGELSSALCTAACKNLAAIFGGHSFTESVLLCAMALLRLVCSKHNGTSSKTFGVITQHQRADCRTHRSS